MQINDETRQVLETVQAWQDAVNDNDLERLQRLSAPDIEILGPRGSGFGHALLAEWLARAGLRLTPKRYFGAGETVVVEQHAVWLEPEHGSVIGEADVASVFKVSRNQVRCYARFDTLDEALIQSGLSLQGDHALI